MLGKTPREAGPRVGYLTQPFSLYQDLSVDENLGYAGGLRAGRTGEYSERRERYFKLFDMDRFTDRLAGRLSGGMKQKLALSSRADRRPDTAPARRADHWSGSRNPTRFLGCVDVLGDRRA